MFLRSFSVFINVFYFVRGDKLWKQVTVDDLHFQGNPTMSLSTSSLKQWHCGVSCEQNPECMTACLSAMMNSPAY